MLPERPLHGMPGKQSAESFRAADTCRIRPWKRRTGKHLPAGRKTAQ
ncbi:MAG: hypothetical protein KDA74_02700 [Planctomycetaceae bacterium]|nr:hypothetical protein [Planctomycetaceae bacterium]